ncbi:YoaK family protein [Bradyrhizobium sp. CCGB12]|uniref:YoaK family protein n=1 Tax=Bradyrhizobium sp. CCGB12 TaxID=2949632 RepID=UPI0020B33311|nr:YoaK family protein [Bradyrhizobium sp. CCGB12]MCP3394706.1 YoaK family protein [Bradyrhizobium sp. CCGB12]
MLRSRRNLALACALSALAGYVDGAGFLHLGGLFVSFMSGNSTRLGVSLAEGHWTGASEAVGLILLFVVGAGIGGLIVHGKGRYRQCWVLLAEATLLAAAGLAYLFGVPWLAVIAMVLAMGLENAVFQVDGGPGIGLTYMTGALVKVGQLAAAALTGGPRWAWLPNLLLWASLVTGAAAGAFAYSEISLAAVWFAAAAALLLAAIAVISVRRTHP